jgi:hypothetical protein
MFAYVYLQVSLVQVLNYVLTLNWYLQSGEEEDPQLIELEQRLRKQQKESEEDSRWLQEEESNLVSNNIKFYLKQHLKLVVFSFLTLHTLLQKKRLSIATSLSDRSDTDSAEPSGSPLSSLTHTQGSQHSGRTVDERTNTPPSNGSLDERDRLIVVKVPLTSVFQTLLIPT